jgi:hypothetical protein
MSIEIESPMGRRLVVRETTPLGRDGREWSVEVPALKLAFKVTQTGRSLHATPLGSAPLEGEPSDDDVIAALALAVDNAILVIRDPRPEVTYEIEVNSQELYNARVRRGARLREA